MGDQNDNLKHRSTRLSIYQKLCVAEQIISMKSLHVFYMHACEIFKWYRQIKSKFQ